MKKLLIIFVLIDNVITQSLKNIFPKNWELTGQCQQCGNCCRRIYLKMTPAQARSRLFCKIAIWWICWLFDFIFIDKDEESHHLIFTCRHLTTAGKCGNYFWRPNICRNYPLVDYFEEPKFLPGCGFSARPKTHS